MRKLTFAIVGYGDRGAIYANGDHWYSEDMKIVAVAESVPDRLAFAKEHHKLKDDVCFESAEEFLKRERMADIACICTQDQDHFAHAIAALEKGYHLLLEKPISISEELCNGIAQKAKECGRTVLVCHVLRYSPFYTTVRDIIRSGKLGEVISLDQIENVGFFHIAHSFVRGKWRNVQTAAPMILAKSCHDMDIIYWLLGKKPERLTSFGSLRHFRAEHAPKGAAARCLDCPVRGDCPYDAVWIYLEGDPKHSFKTAGNSGWPVQVLTDHPSEETIIRALREGPFGRCVYRCDNDVVDHQVVNMEFSEGTTATFSMVGFTAETDRTIKIMGTKGELVGSMDQNSITVTRFKHAPEHINVDISDVKGGEHSGSDYKMMKAIVAHYKEYPLGADGYLASSSHELPEVDPPVCVIDDTLVSHRACFAAEYSRLHGGEAVTL